MEHGIALVFEVEMVYLKVDNVLNKNYLTTNTQNIM